MCYSMSTIRDMLIASSSWKLAFDSIDGVFFNGAYVEEFSDWGDLGYRKGRYRYEASLNLCLGRSVSKRIMTTTLMLGEQYCVNS